MGSETVILLAEDSEGDVFLIRRAFKLAHITNPLFVVRNGAEAIEYLSGAPGYADRAQFPLPDLLLLDINMPVLNGFEVLTWVRQQPNFESLKVVMLTTSNRIADVNQAYKLGANSFFVKPFEFENLVELCKNIHEHWLASARPRKAA